jgi:carbon storage regulator
MLVVSRRPGEKVVIAKSIILTVFEVKGNQIKVGIEAPGEVRILRGEVVGQEDLSETDPDLADKPPEWKDEKSDVVVSRKARRESGEVE